MYFIWIDRHDYIYVEIELWQKWKLGRLSVFNTDEMNECERLIKMIKELSLGVNGFNESEIETFCPLFPLCRQY